MEGIAYIEMAESKIEEFMKKVEKSMPKRVNREDCLKSFQDFGFFRSHKLRQTITGRMLAVEKPREVRQQLQMVPTPSPPKRNFAGRLSFVEESTEYER